MEDFYRKNFNSYVKFVSRSFGGRKDLAEDVVQESFCRALHYIGSYDEKKDFKFWFHRILCNCVRDFQKEERRRGVSYDSEEDIYSVDISIIIDDILDLSKFINTYEGRQLEILRLFYFLRLNSKEISQIVDNTTHSAVRTFLHRFREAYDKYLN
jgi:RNA polymerase sigma-70 factor, ECF subfamily